MLCVLNKEDLINLLHRVYLKINTCLCYVGLDLHFFIIKKKSTKSNHKTSLVALVGF